MKVCAREQTSNLANAMRNGPFVLDTDGSQEGGEQFFPIVVRVLTNQLTIRTEPLFTPTCDESATGENIFDLLV